MLFAYYHIHFIYKVCYRYLYIRIKGTLLSDKGFVLNAVGALGRTRAAVTGVNNIYSQLFLFRNGIFTKSDNECKHGY